MIQGDGGEGLDVVDDGRHAEQAALRRVRRALLRLAALALEGLEQDGLLAEHVGALDGPDRDRRGRGPEPSTSKPMKPASSAAPIAASSRRIASVASARTAMIASVAPIAKAAMAAPSMTANGSRSSRNRSVPVAGSAP